MGASGSLVEIMFGGREEGDRKRDRDIDNERERQNNTGLLCRPTLTVRHCMGCMFPFAWLLYLCFQISSGITLKA